MSVQKDQEKYGFWHGVAFVSLIAFIGTLIFLVVDRQPSSQAAEKPVVEKPVEKRTIAVTVLGPVPSGKLWRTIDVDAGYVCYGIDDFRAGPTCQPMTEQARQFSEKK